jgi:hypothetical protein
MQQRQELFLPFLIEFSSQSCESDWVGWRSLFVLGCFLMMLI